MKRTTTEALVVHCIDFRFQASLNEWIDENLGVGNYDRVALAGSVFDFGAVFKQLEISKRLHEIEKVILINHEDCGAYGVAGTKERHAADLSTAREKVLAQYPSLNVQTYYHHLNGKLELLSRG